MKIEQQPMFQPITITLETNEEASALWELVDARLNAAHMEDRSVERPHVRKFCCDVSNWFSNLAQLGGRPLV